MYDGFKNSVKYTNYVFLIKKSGLAEGRCSEYSECHDVWVVLHCFCVALYNCKVDLMLSPRLIIIVICHVSIYR